MVLQLDAGWANECAAACQLTAAGQHVKVSSHARTHALYSMYVSGLGSKMDDCAVSLQILPVSGCEDTAFHCIVYHRVGLYLVQQQL
jgi:hypothetical protein